MKEISFEEVKRIELDILSYFASFCEKNGLQYFLTYGTLIGAIRHKGFIPWDDDVDIQMPREDYVRLIERFNKDNNSPYRMISPDQKESYYTIVKIIDTRTVKVEEGIKQAPLGVDIDIFPLDGTPEDDKEYRKWYKKLMKCYQQHLALQSLASGSWKYRIKLFFQKMGILLSYGTLNKNGILRRAQKLHAKHPYGERATVGTIECCFNGIKNRLRKEWFSGYVYVPFEDREFRVPIGYDNILKAIYGNYMQLPPEEARVTHHRNNVYWKNEGQ